MVYNRTKNINLLHAYEISVKKNTSYSKKAILAAALELLIFIVFSLFIMHYSSNLRSENAKLQSYIGSFDAIKKDENSYNSVQDIYNEKKYVLGEIQNDNEMKLNAIETLEDIMPSEMSIKTISFNKNNLSLIVTYKNENEIEEFINNLQSSQIFSNIQVDGISSDEGMKMSSVNAEIVRK